MTDCKDCADRGQHIVATRLVRTTPVCDRHMAERLGIPYKPPASIALRLGLSPTPANKEKTAIPGNKPPEQFTIDAMRKDAASGMNLTKIAEKHAVVWITAKKYAGDAVVKTNGAKPAGGGIKRAAAAKSNGAGRFDAILVELRAERDKLSEAIGLLESL